MGHCKVKSSLCSVQQVWWSLHWVVRPGWAVVCGMFGFAECWSFSGLGALLGNHSAQSPTSSVRVASPGHAMGHCKVKCSLCSVQKWWRSLYWVLQPGWAGGLLGCGFSKCWSFQDVKVLLGNHGAQSPASV